MTREMLVNVAECEECRVAVIDNGALEELYVERASSASHVGNVYKGKVVNIEVGIQAAFVDLGTGRNGFLHISDLHPRYFPGKQNEIVETLGRRQSLKDRPPIQDCLRKGKEIVVQVTKEGLKTKGPTLSTYLALPGKYLVMMPWMKKHGISQKIEDEDERKRLKQILDESNPPEDVGCIVRTAGENCAKRDIQSDLRYLARLWTTIEKRIESLKAPGELYQESDLVIRALRDIFNSQITNIVCDSDSMVRKIKDFMEHAYPRMKSIVTTHDQEVPIFHKYGIENEIEKIQARTVDLRTGGSIVIEQTEALVAIDVNSGRHHSGLGAEQTALETNLQAATEIARQLRLRDLGGLIICDFIDMRMQKNRKEVERVFRQAVKADRARSKLLAISRFGVVEMTRQRMRSSLQFSTYLTCPHCAGMGFVKSHESLAIEIIRLLHLAAAKSEITRIELSVSPEVANYLQNAKRTAIAEMEQNTGKRIFVQAMPDYPASKRELACFNARGSFVRLGDLTHSEKQESETHSHRARRRDRNGGTDCATDARRETNGNDPTNELSQDEEAKEKVATPTESTEVAVSPLPVKSKLRSRSRRESQSQSPSKPGVTSESETEAQVSKPTKSSRRRRRGGGKREESAVKTPTEVKAESVETPVEKMEEATSVETPPVDKPAKSSRRRRRSSKRVVKKEETSADVNADVQKDSQDNASTETLRLASVTPTGDSQETPPADLSAASSSGSDSDSAGVTKDKSTSGSSRKHSRPRRRKKRSTNNNESKIAD